MPRHSSLPAASFALLAAFVLTGATCQRRPDPKTRDQAIIHYDLGVQAMNAGDARSALADFLKAVELDPTFDLAHQALGLLYHLSFGQHERAIEHYRKALDLNPKLTEAYTNLANVYLSQNRCEEAIPLYEKALQDILYRTPFIAENNLGWCLHLKGDRQGAIDHIRGALAANPQFCQGHRNLGIILEAAGQLEQALQSYAAFVRHCPDAPEARHTYGMALKRARDTEGARHELQRCVEKAGDRPLAETCRKELASLEQP